MDPDAPALLTNVRQGLLRLHKTLLDWERGNYERTHGRQSTTDLLNAFLQDPHFAWLRPMSQLIVRIDEMLEDANPADGDRGASRARASEGVDVSRRKRRGGCPTLRPGAAGEPRDGVRAPRPLALLARLPQGERRATE